MKSFTIAPTARTILLAGLLMILGGSARAVAWQASAGLRETEMAAASPNQAGASVSVPGPLISFQRIAAISRKAAPEEVLPFLARNVVMDGYQHAYGSDRKPTEFLKLLDAYLDQARELQALANEQGNIRVTGCYDVDPLLRILGYRLRAGCGPGTAVETADPERAFLTVDSGFPLVELEEQ